MIYVIEVGCYSDRRIVTATTNKKRAEQLEREIQLLNKGETVTVYEFEDSKMSDNQCIFVVTFDTDDHYKDVFSEQAWEAIYPYVLLATNKIGSELDNDTGELFYYVAVQANTKEQAKKIACDIIAAYQYDRQGI